MSMIRMVRLDRSRHGGRLLAAGVVALLLWPQLAAAQPVTGPFAKFDGSWRGSGQVVGDDGKRERITCRAHYSIPPSGMALSQSLVCASDSYRFEVQSDVVVTDGHSVQGTWQETTRKGERRSCRPGLGRPVPRQRLRNRLHRGNIPEDERRQTIGDHRPARQQHRQSRYRDVAGELNPGKVARSPACTQRASRVRGRDCATRLAEKRSGISEQLIRTRHSAKAGSLRLNADRPLATLEQ